MKKMIAVAGIAGALLAGSAAVAGADARGGRGHSAVGTNQAGKAEPDYTPAAVIKLQAKIDACIRKLTGQPPLPTASARTR